MKFSNYGQSLFEVVIAVGIIGIIVFSVVALATTSIRNTTFTKNNSSATQLAQDAVEWLRGERDNDWVAFHTNAGSPIYCLDTSSWAKARACNPGEYISNTILTREVTFSGVSGNQVSATVNVYWTDSQGTHQAATSTVFTDWRSR